MASDDEVLTTLPIQQGSRLDALLREAVTVSRRAVEDPSVGAKGITVEMLREAIHNFSMATYEPYRLPPVHPLDYEQALAYHGKHASEGLTESEYIEWASRA